ncbi:MAG: hypothetical protein ABR521_02800, partial [Gaiellaceae bacterium]
VVGCVGLVPDVRRVPGRWRDGDVIFAVAAGAERDLAREAALVRLLWDASPLLSLAHDAGRGGFEACLAEAAFWSGIGAELDGPPEEARAVVACAPEHVTALAGELPLHRLGTAGGDSLLGKTLEELRDAWETRS